MTVEKLKQYRFLKKEIVDIQYKLDNINNYSGIDYDKIGAAENLEKILQDRLITAQALLADIESWLDSVDDSYIRQCIDYHYIRGYSWRATSKKLTGARVDGVVLSNMITRFLKNF